jgi:ABC-type transport system involved in multi-copper enzyme maturation permease subunit
MNVLADFNLKWLADNAGYVAAGLIVLLALAVGIPDMLRLSLKRIWAIGSVGFRESMRRRVLWVTPLAMLGIVAVTQLSHPIDEQDAIRQATKYCLFASGLVVVVATLILACTNLPKEIDNRVIYTIVTKPATRLEIVLGKTVAFARTSAAILLVMGLFSYAYLHVNAAQLAASVQARLRSMAAGDPARDALRHYADEGLLQARTYVRPADLAWGREPSLQIYARVPQPGDARRWVVGNEEQNVLFPFVLPGYVADHDAALLTISVQVAVEQRALSARELEGERVDRADAASRPTTRGAARMPGRPLVAVALLDPAMFTAVSASYLMDARHPLEDPKAVERGDFQNATAVPLEPAGAGGVMAADVVVPDKMVRERLRLIPRGADGERRFFVMVTGLTAGTTYGFGPDAVRVDAHVPDATGKPVPPIKLSTAGPDGTAAPPIFRGRISTASNQQLRGGADRADAPVAVYEFRGTAVGGRGEVPFEFRTRIERSGGELSDAENVTTVEFVVSNRKTGYTSPPIVVTPDTDRAGFFKAPRAAFDGGEFDVRVRSLTPGHFVGLRPGSLAIVSSTQSFAFNLLKSLLILWLLSVLVVIVSIFCSTFVSWPIAVVLALVILLGRWCVSQLGEPTSPAAIADEIFGRNANAVGTRVFTDTLGALNHLMSILTKVLPDVDQFRVTADIERGVTIPYQALLDPLVVIGAYGVPVLLLSYLLLRRKEVAP